MQSADSPLACGRLADQLWIFHVRDTLLYVLLRELRTREVTLLLPVHVVVGVNHIAHWA